MAKTKVDAMWEDLKSKGYFQSDKATFDKYFYAPGEKGYKNRKALYDDLHNKGYLQSPTYEDFAQRIGLHATGNAGNASAHGTTQSMLPADVEERRMRTAKPPTPLNKSKARQRLMQQQQAIQRQQKQWQQQADRLRRYDEKRSTTLPGGMERLGERAQERLATGQTAPVPIAPNPEVVRGDMVMGDDGRMQQSYQVGSTPYTSRAGAEAVLYRQAHPLEDELQQAYLERERLQEQMRNVDSGTHRFNIGSMSAGMPSAYGTYAAVFNSPEFAMLSSAYHKNEQRIKTLERERDADGFWSTLGKELFSLDTWDFGAQEFMDASTMMRYFDRDDLTDQERGARQSMLENVFAKNAADQQYGQNDTFMQRAASITAQALPFVAQFLATGGMSGLTEGGAELGAKAAARWATGKVGEWMLKNTGVLLGDLAAGFAMANTVGMLQTGADIMGRRQGQLMMGPDGSFYFADGKSWGRSIWEGEAANTLEYYTEMLGAHLDGLVAGAIGRAALRPEGKLLGGWFEELGDKVGLSALSDVFSRITGSELQAVTTNILRRGGVNEIPSEIFEEESNLLLNALLVGDNKISDLWDPKTQADIWGGMCLSVGFMQSPGVIGGAYQTAQYYRYKHATDVADQKARARLGDEQWDALKTLLDGASNQEIPVVIANMRADSDMSTLGKTAVMDYAKNLLQMRGYNLRTAAEAKSQLQQPDEAQPAVKDESGTSFAEGYNAGEQDMEPIKNRLEAAQRTLTQMGYDVSALDGRQLQDFSQESLAGMPDDERAALLEFFNARAAFEGMRQKVNDDVDTQVQHASDLVDMQTNRDTGMMHRATLNNGQEVYVTVGRLVMTGDGTMVDTEASDESLFGYNTTTGEVGQYTPQDFKSVDDPVNPEQAKAESAENIRREVAGRAAAAINGDLAFNDGDEFDILGGDNATHHIQVLGQQDEGHVVASIDGGDAQVIPKNELQAMHDNLKDAVKDMEDAAADAENTEEPLQSNGPLDNAAPVEEPFEMPLDDDGEPVWGESTPEQGYQYLKDGELADEDIDSIIATNLANAMAALDEARKDGKKNAIERARKEVKYWDAVDDMRRAEKGDVVIPEAAAPVAENEMKPVEAAPAVETPAEQEPTEQTPEAEIPEQRKSLSEETGVLEGDRGALAQSMSPRTLEMIHKIAQQLGLKIRVYNNPDSAGENGYFDPNSNTIWVNTARRTGKLASWVLGHEMTHAMDARATDKKSKAYKDFKRIAVSFVRSVEGIEAYEARIRRTMERYKNAPGVDASKVTRDYIEDEVACDMAGELLAEGPEFMERLFRDATDRNTLERVLDAVRDFVDRMLSILNANSDEYRALTILRDSMNKMYNDVKIQGEISNELEPEADAEVETDITPADEDRQERKDRQRAKRVKRKRAKRKSVTAIVEGAGMQASENVKETWKVPQADGTFKEEERWVKRPLLDEQGNVVFRMGDKEFNGNNPVSVEDLEENPDTVLNYMLNDAVNIGKLSEKKARQIRQKYADMLNAYLRRGMTDENGTGFDNLENSWMWVGEAAYKTVASNSDEQYSYSLDITRVCKKNEAVIRAISALQVKTGYGVTPGQIMDIYLTTDAEGYQVPCPVCYVFSRYINNGKYATAIVNGMQKYGKYLPGQAEEKDLAWWVDKYNEENAKAKKMKTPIDNANGDVKTILQNIDTLSREITGGTLSDEEREAKLRELHDMDERYRAALDVISQEAMPRWIKAFVLAGSAKDGWRMREDAAMPEDMDDFISHALDIRKTASAMVKYPAITRYRRAGGSAGGKEITFASNNDMGSIAMALGISKSNLDNFNNYYQLALEAGTEEERKALLEKARKRFGDARLYAQRQTLRGGQRMWSWSDNIEALASDVASNLMQLEMLGGALQTYSKQLEGVKMVAAMNGYVNASLMGYGDGVMEVNEDNITTDEEGRRVLANDITEVNNKGRERIIANAGSPIYSNEDGKDYVLVFDDVVGIDPFGHEGNDGKFRRGLFALNEEYDRAGNILVGMNDIHVRAAMADPRVYFIIPWHASGMSNHILMQMFRVLGVDTDNFKATDYTKMQEETNFLERTEKGKLKHKVTQSVRDFWNSHTYEGEFRSGLGHIPNGDRKDGLSKQQLHYRELRDAIFDGTIDNEDKKDWKRQVERDEFLSQVYRQVTTRVADGKMTEKDKEFIYPYEYWDESSTYETADINGKRYLEYCRRMGFKPKFTGRYDEKAGYSPEGNFADDPGYWKLLIDRRMYDREGKFQDLTPVDSEGLEPNMYDPKETQKEFNVTEVATNEGAERIADIVYQQEVERSGSMPTPNLNTTLEGAVEQYKDTVKRQADRVKAEKKAKEAEEAARIKAEKAAERARKKAEREAERAKQRKSLGDIIDEALQSTAIHQPEEANDSNIRYSLRTKPAPKKTLPVYKLMRLGDDGKLYPLYIDGAVPIELGQWYDADSPNMEMLVNLPAGVHLINPETGEATSLEDYNKQRGITKKSKYPSAEAVNEATANGMRWVYIEPTKGGQRRFGGEARRYWNLGINGSGTVSTYSMRPGWHAGSLPTMRQIGKGPGRNLRDDRFVWVEGEISADVDYNEEAHGNPDNDIPTHIPVDGFYLKATNANAKASQADRVGWYISGAFKANRIMSDSEARDVIDAWNADPKHKDMQVEYDFPRESGKVFNAETMQLENDDNGPDGPKGGKRFSIDDAAYAEAVEAGDRKKVAMMVKDAVKAAMPNTKAVDRWGKPRLLYHGTPQEDQFYEFNGTIYMSSNRSVANEYTHYRRTFGANPRQTGRIMPVFVNLENPLEIDANRHLWRNIDVEWSDTPVTTRDIEQYAKDNGYDGVIIKRVRDNMYDNDTTAADVYIAFSPEQVKSAGPTYEQKKRSHFPWDDYMELDGEVGATYDDEGNLIPLSERFDMGKADIRYSVDAAVAEAEQMTETNPTDGQKESGNYRKGHVKVDGFDISIEQPKGSVRSGVDADGNEWSQEMHNTYGYIRGTEGVDGDHIDVFLSDHLDGWNGNVYVVDQVNKDGSFDEHKVMYGFNSEQEARDAYLSNYEEGWTGLDNITGVSREEFKKWVDSSHRKTKPFAEYKSVKPLQSTGTEDRARFSISERTDEAGNEVYTETREDGTKDREVVTMPDGSRDVTWFDEAGRKKEVLSYYPNGEVRQVNNYDSEGDLTRLIQYDENRRAIRHWEPRIGTDWERDENGVARGRSNGVEMRPYGSRFSLAPTFYSNAARAVEGVKQEKAKAEQWKAMLTKAGGIKAGEDKWMGLSTWLDEHKGETLTKDEVAQFVRDNAVQMKETHYGEIDDDIIEEKLTPFEDEFNRLMDEAQDATDSIFTSEWGEWAYNQMREHYGDDFEMAFALTETINGYPAIVPNRNFDGALDDAAKYFLGLGSYGDMEDINATRLDFTTPGLKNKREIAFVVPDVEPYQEYDEIHFGPENQGRAIMWVRFGETTDTDGNRVLVIDEVQSNRHQDAREKGYRSNEDYKNVQSFRAKLSKEHPEGWSVDNESARKSGLYILSKEEHEELMRLNSKAYGGENRDGIPAAPFERNWHEVAMKRMLRLAAEEGFDKVAWTTGMQQAERYNLGQVVDSIEARNYNERNRKDYNGLQRQITIYTANGETALYVTADGYIYDVEGQGLGVQLEGNTLDNVVGKDLASRLMIDEDVTLSGDGLNVGGEGMRAFYDGILPQFMNKYGKRWGVKTGEVTLTTPGKEVMHSVDVNEDMKRSVMQGQPLFSLGVEQERTLMGMHNITAEKLLSALKLGGLANPSMAVINTEVGGFTNFGEISLIPSADLIASRTGGNAGTWGADAYSPRFPDTHRRLGKGGDKKMHAWVKGLKMRKEMEYNTEEQFNDYYNGFNIRDNALVYPFLHEKGLSGEVDYYTHMNVDQRLEDDLREANGDQFVLLKRFDEDDEYKKKLTDIVVGDEVGKIHKKEGESFQEFRDRRREWAKQIREALTEEDGYINRNLAEDLLYAQARAYRENGKFSESRTVSNAEQYIRDHGMEEEYKQYFNDKMQEIGAETQVYAGSDSQGRSKYKPVSLDQVSRMMKRQGRAGGEGGIFADSPGAIRAKLLTPMKTLDQIRAKKDRIVSHEAFEQFRERYREELREYADVYARGSMGVLADIITSSNMAATAKRYNIDLDADAVAELNKFKNRVRALPTEYFETKFERPVMLDEFKKAIIPDDLPLDLQGALQRAGLEVVAYKHGDNADRERVTLDAVKNDGGDIRFSISDEEQEAQTHSANFKRWFGDWENDPDEASKVVDSDGRPKVVLHGTPNNEFYAFDPEKAGSNTDQGWLGKGFYFYGNAPEYASQYAGKNGRVLKVYLDIKNPYIATVEDFNRLAEANNPEESRRFRERLEEEGYDGVFYNGDLNEEWVAFRPEQIKSATENNGDFSRENPDIRFSLSGDGTVEEYNKAVNMTGRTFNVGGREVKPGLTRYNFQEAFQDSILAVKKLQQVIERHFGIKLPTRENAWMYENRLSSINMHERKSFIDKVYEPMMKIADAIMKRGVKEKDLNAYLICKHGLERNQVFAMRDANEEANEIARNGGTPDMQQLIDKYRQRDYSGLTGVTGIQGDISDIEAEAQRIVDEFEQKHGQLCNELWDAIRKATQWSLRKSYQSGMMSAATFDHVRNMFQYYVPLRGWSETTAEDVYSYMMGEHGAFNGVLKKAEGRTSVADDPLATIGNMAESALIQGNRNLLKQHLLRMAQNHPTDVCQVRDVWLVEGPGGVWEPHWPNIPDDATPDEIDQILQDHEADMQQLEASGQAKRVRNNLDIPYRIDPRHVPEHAVVAKVAGVDHVIYINGNPRAAQAINGQTGAGRGTKSGFSRLIDFIFGDVKRFYSSVLTSLNINFSGANFVRDLPHAYAMTFMKQGPLKAAEYIAKSFQVIPWVFKNQLGKTGTSQMDRYFQEFLSSGSVTGYAHINDVDAWKADNKRRFARLSALGKAKVAVPRALGEVINAIGWFSETLELIPRFTAFLAERQAGKDIATATKAAKDITTNFNKKGSEVTPGVWGAVANTLRYMKMFFNPIVQGMYQFVDVASMGKENKLVGPRMVLATMHLPVLGAIVPYLNQFLLEALGGDDDDDYWLLNEYTRRNNVCIFTGNGYLKIPIAPVFRELYGMGEVVATRHAGKADNEKTTVDLIDQLRTMGSVEGQSSYNEWSLARFLLPEHFAPLIDVMNNENFTGGPIYYDNNYKEYAPEYTKAKKSTWSPLVAASKWLNEMMGGDEDIAADNSGKWMNPAVWQHLITNVGGGFAQLAGDVVAGVTDITEGKEIDPSNIPVIKRFYSGSSDERANWARFGIYKDYEKDYTMAKEKYQALDKRGLSLTERADEMVKFAESHPKAAAIYAVWEGGIKGADIPQQLSKLGKDDPKYWDLVKDAVAKAEKAMNSGYVRAWEQKRKDRPDSMSDKELNDRFDKSDNDSIRHIMADEISKRAGSQDYYGRDAQATWSDKSVAAWEAYQDQRTSDDIKADAELSNLLKVDEDEKDKERIKMLGYIKDELNKIRRGKDATSRSAGVKGLGEGDDQRVMNELRAARKQLIEDLKTGSAEQAYRNLERRTMRLGLRKKAKEL